MDRTIERMSDLAEKELPHVRLEDLAQRAPLGLRRLNHASVAGATLAAIYDADACEVDLGVM